MKTTNVKLPEWFDATLEDKLDLTFNELKINNDKRKFIENTLEPLKEKNLVTLYHYQHCINVGMLSKSIARFMHLDQKALFYAGLLHDCGKSCIYLETLAKADVRLGSNCEWTKEDAERMESHVIEGYNILKNKLDFTAEIVVRHHRYQKNQYPKYVPQFLHDYSEGTKVLIGFYSRLVALADVYDAFHRINKKSGKISKSSDTEIKEGMLRLNSDLKFLIEDLYTSGIFHLGDKKC